MTKTNVTLMTLCGLTLSLCVTALISLKLGAARISWEEVFIFLSDPDRHSHLPHDTLTILRDLRLPRTLASIIIGATLGLTGLMLQSLLRNPLAEPYTMGLSGGSAFGAIVALALGLEPARVWLPIISAAGCFLALAIVVLLGGRNLNLGGRTFILYGMMTSLFFGALVVTGMSFLPANKVQVAVFWMMGEFGTTRDSWIYQFGPILIAGWLLLFRQHRALDALTLGDARTLSLGFEPKKHKIVITVLSGIFTALCISIAGLVGFIGLVSPHLARRLLRTSAHRFLMVGTLLIGAVLLTLADTVGKSLGGTTEVPAGSIAALIGAPLLVVVLRSQVVGRWHGEH
jgi:iron complex transport system permease protein